MSPAVSLSACVAYGLKQALTRCSAPAAYWNEQALGYIYLEAYKAAYVTEALSGLRGVYHSKMALVLSLLALLAQKYKY